MQIRFTIHPDVLAAAMKEWEEIDAFHSKRKIPRSALNYTHWAAGDVMLNGHQVMLAPRYGDEPIMTFFGGRTIEVRLKMNSIQAIGLGTDIEFGMFRSDEMDGSGDLIVTQTVLSLHLSGQPMPTRAESEAYTQLIAEREIAEQAKPSAEWQAQIADRQGRKASE